MPEMCPATRAKPRDGLATRFWERVGRLAQEAAESPIGCFAVGEYQAPLAQRQRNVYSQHPVMATSAESEQTPMSILELDGEVRDY